MIIGNQTTKTEQIEIILKNIPQIYWSKYEWSALFKMNVVFLIKLSFI